MTDNNLFNFIIVQHLGIISVRRYKGQRWRKELNIVSWNGREPKFDIREWSEGHEQMRSGITLSRDEVRSLAKLLYEDANEKAI